MIGRSKFAVLAGLLVALSTDLAVAMEAPAAAEQAGQRVEEVSVTAERSVFALTQQVEAAEDRMYDLYNELNTDDQFDIECNMETRLFSHTKEKICLPVYSRKAMLNEAQNRVRGGQGQMSMDAGAPTDVRKISDYPELQEKFQEMMRQNPEFFSAVAKHYELNELLRLRRKAGDDE